MLMELVSLQKGNVKKRKKEIKIVNIERRKSSYFLNNLRIFNETFREDKAY